MMAITTGAGGLLGWKILQRTESRQIEILRRDAVVQRSTSYLRDNPDKLTSPEALVGDYRMLSAVLSAFGLENDVANKAFIRKVLESDLSDRSALVNRLSDKRYLRMAEALGFSAPGGPSADLGDRLGQAFIQREYERRVGAGDEDLRLALNARREIAAFADNDKSATTQWYEVMGNPPMRKVFETALGFGPSFGKLPVERQNAEFMKAAQRQFGTSSLAELAEPAATERLIISFLARAQLTQSVSQNRYSAALTLLARP
ncbi:DUF1217 domain-containing protein [Paracoccus sp. NSM]|uniref:DUF1217 domain-containing protein n=1 Tax=Paracoccus sp. NSM TaxID=3457784 RepID=UPI004036C972